MAEVYDGRVIHRNIRSHLGSGNKVRYSRDLLKNGSVKYSVHRIHHDYHPSTILLVFARKSCRYKILISLPGVLKRASNTVMLN